jgi:hypothetical protein
LALQCRRANLRFLQAMSRFLLLCGLTTVRCDACECVSAAEVAATGVEDHPPTYGAGCDAHDGEGGSGVIPQCAVTEGKPAWCYRQWCYVNVSCYGVFHPDHHQYGDVARSYEACGELPMQYFGNNLAGTSSSPEHKEMAGVKLRAFMLNNTGGWTGSFLDAKGKNVKAFGSQFHGDSPYVAFAKSLAAVGEFEFEFRDPLLPLPASVIAQVSMHPRRRCTHARAARFSLPAVRRS